MTDRQTDLLQRAFAVAEKAVERKQWDNSTGLQFVQSVKLMAENGEEEEAEELLTKWEPKTKSVSARSFFRGVPGGGVDY